VVIFISTSKPTSTFFRFYIVDVPTFKSASFRFTAVVIVFYVSLVMFICCAESPDDFCPRRNSKPSRRKTKRTMLNLLTTLLALASPALRVAVSGARGDVASFERGGGGLAGQGAALIEARAGLTEREIEENQGHRSLPHSSLDCWIFVDMSTGNSKSLNLAEVQALKFDNSVISAIAATLSTTFSSQYSASRCIDGDSNNLCRTDSQPNDWLRIDDSDASNFLIVLNSVKIYNIVNCCQDRIVGATVFIGCSQVPPTSAASASLYSYKTATPFSSAQSTYTISSDLSDFQYCPSNCDAGSGCNLNSQTCESCPVGHFSGEDRVGPCLSCGSGTTESTGSTSAGQCICDVGYFPDGSSCTRCPDAFTTSSTGSTSADQCVYVGGMVLVAGEGRCAVEGNCIANYEAGENYEDDEDCTFRLDGIEGPLVFEQFDIESHSSCNYDYLTIAGSKYCGETAPTGLLGGAESEITWHTDGSGDRTGFKVCVAYCPSNCSAGSGCELDGSTSSCAVCPGEQNDRVLESRTIT